MLDALNMGGYAAYVWPCYAVTLFVLVGLAVTASRAVKRQQRALAELDEEAARPAPADMVLKDAGE